MTLQIEHATSQKESPKVGEILPQSRASNAVPSQYNNGQGNHALAQQQYQSRHLRHIDE
jgi:hypothetical protein